MSTASQYQTKEFLPETGMDEINAIVNGFFCGPMNKERKVLNIHVSMKEVEKETAMNTGIKSARRNSLFFEKGAPMCVLSLEGPRGNREYARTEVCWNTSLKQYHWIKPFTLEVYPDTKERLVFDVYDVTSPCVALEKQRHFAASTVELETLLSGRNQEIRDENYIELEMINPKNGEIEGILKVSFYELKPNVYGSLICNFKIDGIHSPARMIKSANPMIIIQRSNGKSMKFVSVLKTNVKEHKNSCEWPFVELNLQLICGGDLDLPIRINLLDYIKTSPNSKNHSRNYFNHLKGNSKSHIKIDIEEEEEENNLNLIGFSDTTMRRLMDESEIEIFDKEGHHKGKISIEMKKKVESPRFFDFQLRGIKVRPILAIDFSSTSIDAFYSNRLQHIDNGQFSYQGAIQEIYDSIRQLTNGQPYVGYAIGDFNNTSKIIPFKDIKRNTGLISNGCNVDMNDKVETEMKTLDSIISAYQKTRAKIEYPAKATLEPIVIESLKVARESWEKERAVSLLIVVTNGKFSDLQKAIDRMVDGEKEPLITLMVLMDGMRADINQKMSKCEGKLVDSLGRRSNRRLVDAAIFHDDKIYPDHKFGQRINPVIKQMVVEAIKGKDIESY